MEAQSGNYHEILAQKIIAGIEERDPINSGKISGAHNCSHIGYIYIFIEVMGSSLCKKNCNRKLPPHEDMSLLFTESYNKKQPLHHIV